MRRHNLDLILILSILLLYGGYSLLSLQVPVLGLFLILPLLFVAPGYLLTEAITHTQPSGSVERMGLSVTISLCIVLLSGFLLNWLPAGLTAGSWSLFLGGLNTILGLFVLVQRRQAPRPRTSMYHLRLKFSGFLVVGSALLIIVIAFHSSIGSITTSSHTGFTQLWLLPSQESSQTRQVNFGLHSEERTPITYLLTMNVNQVPFKRWSSITLKPDQAWHQVVSLPITTTYVQVQLYRGDQAHTVYREVHITLSPYKDTSSWATPTVRGKE